MVEFQDYKDEAIIEVMNGCICCTVRQDLITTLKDMKEKYFDTGKIDYIIIDISWLFLYIFHPHCTYFSTQLIQ